MYRAQPKGMGRLAINDWAADMQIPSGRISQRPLRLGWNLSIRRAPPTETGSPNGEEGLWANRYLSIRVERGKGNR